MRLSFLSLLSFSLSFAMKFDRPCNESEMNPRQREVTLFRQVATWPVSTRLLRVVVMNIDSQSRSYHVYRLAFDLQRLSVMNA
jgi:hypothetical protein